MLERLAVANAEIARVVKVDVTVESSWAQEQKIQGVPAFQLYNDGELVHEFVGTLGESDFQKKIEFYALSSEDREEKGAPEKSIQAMPKDWLPPGISRS